MPVSSEGNMRSVAVAVHSSNGFTSSLMFIKILCKPSKYFTCRLIEHKIRKASDV